MYFKEKENTSIDSEFQGGKKFDIKKYKLVIIIVTIIVVFFVTMFVVFKLNNSKQKGENITYNIELKGSQNMIITLGNDYIEYGYNAFDSNGNNLTNQVEIKSNINVNEIGNYEISYTVGDKTVIRRVEIREQAPETYIYLKGNKNIYLDLNEKYKEPGYVAHDTIDGDVTSKVKVTGSVNPKKKGLYKIVYSYTNTRDITTQIERNVIVGENKPQQ